MAVYGSVDAGASVDGLIPATPTGVPSTAGPGGGGAQGGIDLFKWFNHITTPDRIELFHSPFTAPYNVLRLNGTHKALAIDSRYPAGRFQVFEYRSADAKPLNLLDVVWITDLQHAFDLREAEMEWDYFRHWRRNADTSLTYSER